MAVMGHIVPQTIVMERIAYGERIVDSNAVGSVRVNRAGCTVVLDLVFSDVVVLRCDIEQDSTILVAFHPVVVEYVVLSLVDPDTRSTIVIGLIVRDLVTGRSLKNNAIERAGSYAVLRRR